MAKRFTDTDKWKKGFIRGLEGPYKLLWLYILDDCDMAGIWQKDFEVACIRIGEDVTEKKALEVFGGRIKIFGNKWFVVDFIQFQYGELKETNRMHVAVLNTLIKNEISTDGASKPLPRGQGQGQGKGQGKGEGQEQGDEFDFSKPDIPGDEVYFPIDTKKVRDHWVGWKKSRWENHNARYAMMGEQAALKQLERLSEDQVIDTLLKAIAGKWKNLYPEHSKNGTSKTTQRTEATNSRREGFAKRNSSNTGG